jgi:hypothetical protein
MIARKLVKRGWTAELKTSIHRSKGVKSLGVADAIGDLLS